MPPHCDTLDGPVVTSAKLALEKENVNLILPWVPKEAEEELADCFKKTLAARVLGQEAQEVADHWFYETTVRLHRAGEGASYSGLKPAGLDWGPVVRKAERAVEIGSVEDFIPFLSQMVELEVSKKFNDVKLKTDYDVDNVSDARQYIDAMLEFILFTHHLYKFATAGKGHTKRIASEGRAA